MPLAAVVLALAVVAMACAADPAGHDTSGVQPSVEESAAAVTEPPSPAETLPPEPASASESVPSEVASASGSVPSEVASASGSVPSEVASAPESPSSAPDPADIAGVPGPPQNLRNGCATEDLDVDWFPEKVQDTPGISVVYRGNIKVVTLGADQAEPATILLLQQCGTSLPADLPAGEVVEIPVRQVATDAPGLIAALAAFGRPDVAAEAGTSEVPLISADTTGALSDQAWVTLAALLLNAEADAEPILSTTDSTA